MVIQGSVHSLTLPQRVVPTAFAAPLSSRSSFMAGSRVGVSIKSSAARRSAVAAQAKVRSLWGVVSNGQDCLIVGVRKGATDSNA